MNKQIQSTKSFILDEKIFLTKIKEGLSNSCH